MVEAVEPITLFSRRRYTVINHPVLFLYNASPTNTMMNTILLWLHPYSHICHGQYEFMSWEDFSIRRAQKRHQQRRPVDNSQGGTSIDDYHTKMVRAELPVVLSMMDPDIAKVIKRTSGKWYILWNKVYKQMRKAAKRPGSAHIAHRRSLRDSLSSSS